MLVAGPSQQPSNDSGPHPCGVQSMKRGRKQEESKKPNNSRAGREENLGPMWMSAVVRCFHREENRQSGLKPNLSGE